MANVKLSYFDFSGSRGEECRIALHVAGVAFEDNRIKRGDWAAMKPTTPFGAMPVLEVEGHGVLAQSNAILGLIGRRHGLLPEDDFQAAQHVALMDAAEDLRHKVRPTMDIKDEEERKRVRTEIAGGYLKHWSQNVERQIEGPFAAGQKISVADIKLYIVMNWFKKGVLDHFSADCFDAYPKLTAMFAAVAAHPKVAEWTAKHA